MFILPINKDNPVRKIPWVVLALIGANTIILAFTYNPPTSLYSHYGFVPAHPHVRAMLTSMFLHAGFWHPAGNMFFLWMFGNQVENTFGHWLLRGVRHRRGRPALSVEHGIGDTVCWRFRSNFRNR